MEAAATALGGQDPTEAVQEPLVAGESPVPERVLVVPGDPVPWAVKSRNPKNPYGKGFLPARTEKAIGRGLTAIESAGLPVIPPEVPVKLVCDFYIERLKGHYGTGRNAETIKDRFLHSSPTKAPDLSNLVKLIEDVLVMGRLLLDDDQVTEIVARKHWTANRREAPRTVVRIIEL